jgi:acyl-coenzyme A synthetase/AMP-(fatty) acid ligase
MISRRLIFKFVAERVNKHKYLNGGIEFLTELPGLASGKIAKMSLKATDGFGQQ